MIGYRIHWWGGLKVILNIKIKISVVYHIHTTLFRILLIWHSNFSNISSEPCNGIFWKTATTCYHYTKMDFWDRVKILISRSFYMSLCRCLLISYAYSIISLHFRRSWVCIPTISDLIFRYKTRGFIKTFRRLRRRRWACARVLSQSMYNVHCTYVFETEEKIWYLA